MCAKPVDVDRYPPRVFGRMIGRSVSTLQRWDREGALKARRTRTDRRHHTHDNCLAVIGQQPKQGRTVAYGEDVGSGLKYLRENFLRAMEQVERGEVSEIVVRTTTGWCATDSSGSRSLPVTMDARSWS